MSLRLSSCTLLGGKDLHRKKAVRMTQSKRPPWKGLEKRGIDLGVKGESKKNHSRVRKGYAGNIPLIKLVKERTYKERYCASRRASSGPFSPRAPEKKYRTKWGVGDHQTVSSEGIGLINHSELFRKTSWHTRESLKSRIGAEGGKKNSLRGPQKIFSVQKSLGTT